MLSCRRLVPIALSLILGLSVENAAFGDALAEQARLKADVEYLADDRLEGRDVGTPGGAQAAAYIRDRFRQLGLASGTTDGSYFQVFEVQTETKIGDSTMFELVAPDGSVQRLQRGVDYQPLTAGGKGAFEGPIVFAGYSITSDEPAYDDFAAIELEGKIALIIRREPQLGDAESPFNGTELSRHAELKNKIANAWKKKAAAILIVNDPWTIQKDGKDELMAPNFMPGSETVAAPVLHISMDVANRILKGSKLESVEVVAKKIDDSLAPQSSPIDGWSAKGDVEIVKVEVQTPNVVGVIEGEGPHADETIVIGAHYDHIGMGGPNSRSPNVVAIHNGADDNASGTAALLELAKRFAEQPAKPSRRLVFIAFSGEERGLLGSQHYVKKDPLVPLDKTVMMINFDMVGRLRDGKLIVYGTKTAEGIEELVQQLDEKDASVEVRGVPLGIPASDHSSFYQAKIPALHFFTGTHAEYHMPTDDPPTINYEGMQVVTDYAAALIEELLARKDSLAYSEVKEDDPHAGLQIPSGENVPYLGTSPDYGDETEGVLLNGVREGSPGEKGGLKAGDIIVELGGTQIQNVRQYTTVLYSHKPDDKVKIVVLRGEEDKKERVELDVTLGRRGNPARQ